MIVVAVVTLLTAIAVPSFLRARSRTRLARFANELRIVRDGFDLYASEHNGYPPDAEPFTLPPAIRSYFGPKIDWSVPTPIGGHWDWDNQYVGITGVSVWTTTSREVMTEVDAMVDDGDLSTGSFRETQANRYTCLLGDQSQQQATAARQR